MIEAGLSHIRWTCCHPCILRTLFTEGGLVQLVEVVLDLGRPPYVRLPQGDVRLSEAPVSQFDLEAAVARVRITANFILRMIV